VGNYKTFFDVGFELPNNLWPKRPVDGNPGADGCNIIIMRLAMDVTSVQVQMQVWY